MINTNQTQFISSLSKSPASRRPRGGFTLIELLVVILIILLVSAVALPVVLPALSHRQVSEAARILQGALVGARDAALHNGTPSGIRLVPDPAFPLIYLPNGQIDPTQPLAYNRIIPIESAPEYSTGMLFIAPVNSLLTAVPYPAINGGGVYPFGANSIVTLTNGIPPRNVLMVKESVANNGVLNEPTSWFWNVRVGDKLQINGSGLWYTVVGPMVVPPQGATINGVFIGNSESFVNVGPAGTQSYLTDLQSGTQVFPEFLFLVNGLDDNGNGWIDEGYDGVNNNLAYEVANSYPQPLTDDLLEWEFETWPPTIANQTNAFLYTIQRRPAPTQNAREISLPTNVVIDMTTWNNAFAERSQFPPGVINPYTGYIDILLYPNGTVVPTTLYSTPSSFGMSGAFFHFWLAERADVRAPSTTAANPPFLPIGNINQRLVVPANPYLGASLQGEYRVITLFTRTGQITTNDNAQFDNPLSPANGATYNPLYPFLSTEQGSKGSR